MKFHELENARLEAGLSISAFCRKARVSQQQYYRYRKGDDIPRRRTVEKFRNAIHGRPVAPLCPRSDLPPEVALANLYRAYVAIIAPELSADPKAVIASNPSLRATSSSEWQTGARVRALAVYCVSIELNVPAARVAAAIGVTRQAASQMLQRVEDFRENPEIDALVERVGKLVSGRT